VSFFEKNPALSFESDLRMIADDIYNKNPAVAPSESHSRELQQTDPLKIQDDKFCVTLKKHFPDEDALEAVGIVNGELTAHTSATENKAVTNQQNH